MSDATNDAPPPPPLALFGPPALASGGAPLMFRAERHFQLLAYLACRRRWVRRDELAELFWPDRDAARARANLRKVLLLARQLDGIGEIEQQGDLLRWAPDSDLQRFEQACDDGRFDDALSLADAPLLDGLDAGLSPAAADWLAFERQRLQSRWQAAGAARLAALDGAPAQAAELARRMLDRDPLDETALHALARAQLALGRPAQARRAIDAHAQQLASAFGLEPSAATRGLAREVQGAAAGAVSPAPAQAAPPRAAPATGFIGRRSELAQLQRIVEQKPCRLLTLTGPAGTGKSAFARHAMSALAAAFDTPARWVPLEDLTDAAQVPARIAAALALRLGGQQDPWTEIAAALGDRAVLLVLDNAEHLALAGALPALLRDCPALRLLVTSRTRLGADGEWLLPLDGLPLPDEDETDLAVLRSCDSVRLFEDRALALSPGFSLAAHAAGVVRVVHAVGGLPLAIELAASWTRVMPVADIAAELAGSLDLLEPRAGAPLEHSVRHGFAQSWKWLVPAERDALARIALLPGPFGRAMALQVAQASLPLLASLVDKALLRADGDGRFSMHPLLRQCAAEHAGDTAPLLARHAAHVANWAGRFADALRPPQAEFEAELPHLRAAWAWACAQRDALAIAALVRPLMLFYEERGLWAESLASLERAIAAFDDGTASRERLQLTLLRSFATLQYRAGRLVDADASARRVLLLARRLGDGAAAKSGLNTLGLSLWQRGQFAQARPYFEQARRRAVADGDRRGIAVFSGNLAMVDKAQGRYAQALDGYRDALAMDRALGTMGSVVTTLNNIANVLRALGRPREALPVLHEAAELSRAHGLSSSMPTLLVNLGLVHDAIGERGDAAAWFEKALAEAHAHGEPIIEAATLLALASLDARAGAAAAVRQRIVRAQAIADTLGSPAVQIQCVLGLGELLAHERRIDAAAALLQWGIAQASLNSADRDDARRTLDALALGPDALARAAARLPADAPLARALALATTPD